MDFLRNILAEYRRYLRLAGALFAASLVLGVLAAFLYPALILEILSLFEEQFGVAPALDINLAWAIFRQNLIVSLVAWLGGSLVGLVPAMTVLVNGFILGYVLVWGLFSFETPAQGLALFGLGIAPHGIIEIPALLAAAALGFRLGLDWLSAGAAGRRLETLKESLLSTGSYFPYVAAALAVAAIIEVYVSGHLVNNL